MSDERLIVEKFGKPLLLASEVVNFLKNKEITYGEAISALEDALQYLRRTSLMEKL